MNFPYIIADIGSNWFRPGKQNLIAYAVQHIEAAADCGVSAVKFQYFSSKELYGFDGPADQYSLPLSSLPILAARASDRGIDFLCTAFSVDGIREVDPFVNMHKIASAENKHIEMLEALPKGKPVLISTGCMHEDEWEKVVMKYRPDAIPMECVGSYPAPWKDYNLTWLADRYERGETWGLSDHTLGNPVSCAALGAGAKVFEKHFNAMPYSKHQTPDAPVSMDPPSLKLYCDTLKALWPCMQHERKFAQPSENDFVLRHRRRLKAVKKILAGDELIYGDNYGIYRSVKNDPSAFGGEMAMLVNGAIAKKDFMPGDGIGPGDIG